MKSAVFLFAAVLLLAALPAGAQIIIPGGGGFTPPPDLQGRRISTPGALLDDYNVVDPGTLNFTFGAGYAKNQVGHDLALPFYDIHYGLNQRVDFGISASLSQSQYEQFKTTATGDAYLDAKVVVVPEGKRRPGIAFQPVLEVLGRPSLVNNALAPAKVNGVFGGIIGKALGDNFRIYNHTGYFTRGIVFSSTALEITRFAHITPVVFGSFASLTSNRDVAAQLELNASRPDVGASLGFRLSKNWTGYISGSRSLGRRDANSIDYSFSGGLSYAWRIKD